MSSGDRALDALRRLLAEAERGGQAKVDALAALAQRTLLVATWTSGGDDYRTLTSSQSLSALPVFTDEQALKEAAARFGWLGPDGSVPLKEISARESFRYLLAHDLGFLLVDLASPHALECERAEVEPLLSTRARSEALGPLAGIARLADSARQTVEPHRPSTVDAHRPSTVDAHRPSTVDAHRPSTVGAPSSAMASPTEGLTVSQGAVDPSRPHATFGSGGASARVLPLRGEPSDDLLDALATFLRGFPEVEWAALFLAARGPVDPVPTVGLRVDIAYRARIGDIVGGLRQAADAAGASIDVLLLDDPKIMRAARAEGLLFFPWKRRG